MTQADYLPVAIFALVALIFPFLAFFATRFFRPEKPHALKAQTYECGEVPRGEAHIQFSFQYYIFALIFVVFDSVSIFLLLWALVLPGLDLAAKVSMFLFILVLLAVLAHALKKEEALAI
ncbi:MAG: NADH-quinone oxidoreductase subunit A [Euryarchaeota archaeon]|nr:NADH-quinone oxidoreductase subunit A [Euryarchaeota archaeon]